jgi:CheY-like chemotaxis protein
MKLFVIDENTNFANIICEHFRDYNGLGGECFIVRDIADNAELAERVIKLLENDSVIFIHINLKINELRQSHQGIELLTWLRIKGAMNHCVLYSFQSAEAIARSSEKNRLLFSKGTTFVQLPDDFSSINLKALASNAAEASKLKENIKPLFNAGEFRHRNANWWGVKQLWDIHRIYKKGAFDKPYPQNIRDNLTNLNNAVGTFLHSLEVVLLTKYIDFIAGEIEKTKGELIIEIKKIKNSKKAELAHLSGWDDKTAAIRKQIQDIEDNFQKYCAQTSSEYQTFEEEKSILTGKLIEIQKESSETGKKVSELQAQLNLCQRQLDKYHWTNSKIFETAKRNLFKEINLPPPNRKTRILLIDDNAENGWGEILKEITGATIKTFVPAKKFIDKPEQLYQNVKKLLARNGFNPHLIMLDLRLFDETDRSINIENLSGKLLLQRIKQEFRGIPVMITAASNKIWTYQSLINLGAEAYWIKEGIDEQREAIDSVNNYCKLLRLVSRMTGEPYKILKKLSDFSEEFERQKAAHWSAKHQWANYETTDGRTDEISKSLNEAVCVLKDYLHNHYLNFGADSPNTEAFVLSGLINKIAGVYELVHNLKEGQTARDVGIDYPRGDKKAQPLIKLRNKYSHGHYQTANWATLKRCIELTEIYLSGRK